MTNTHHETLNEDTQVAITDNYLSGRSIALCVSGGIAAIETPKVARALRRVGAQVHAYMTDNATLFVGKAALEWGTGNPVVDKLSGLAEHIAAHDAVLVCPATLNTINKTAAGIADSPVTTMIASALGKRTPVLVAPTMHDSLWNNPFLVRSVKNLYHAGVQIIPPRSSEGKQKIPPIDALVAATARAVARQNPDNSPFGGLVARSLLYTAGPTPVAIDGVRRITNIFKGTLGLQLAVDAYLRGADVKLLYGPGATPPAYLPAMPHKLFEEYQNNVLTQLCARRYDAGIFCAAVADYKPVKMSEGKLPSEGALQTIAMTETPKIIQLVRQAHPQLPMITFKFETDVTTQKLLEIARARVAQGYQAVVANRSQDMIDGHTAYLVTAEGEIKMEGRKAIVAGVNGYLAQYFKRS